MVLSYLFRCVILIFWVGEEIYEFEYKLDLPNGRKVHTWSNVGLKQPEEGRLQPNLSKILFYFILLVMLKNAVLRENERRRF